MKTNTGMIAMRRCMLLLCLALLPAWSPSALANPANCDGDLDADRAEMLDLASGLNPLIDGVVTIMRTCEKVKQFVSSLGVSKGTTALSNQQVEQAVTGMGSGPGGASSCLWNFDAAACERYLGLAETTSFEVVDAPAAAEGQASSGKKPTSVMDAQAKLMRSRLAERNSTIYTQISLSCRGDARGACAEASLPDIDALLREVEEMNANPDYNQYLPAYQADVVEYAQRLGWTRQEGRWVYDGAEQKPGKTHIAGVTPEDCERLQLGITQELAANPKAEPPNLPFFEVECATLDARYGTAATAWRDQLTASAVPPAPGPAADVPGQDAPEPLAAIDSLEEWNEETAAEVSGNSRPVVRRFVLPGGCYIDYYTYALTDGSEDTQKIEWNGPCTKDAPVNGTGTLYWGSEFADAEAQQAPVVNGRLHGTVLQWDFHGGDSSTFWRIVTYANGCEVSAEYLGLEEKYLMEKRELATRSGWSYDGGRNVFHRAYKGVKYYAGPGDAELLTDSFHNPRECAASFARYRP
jgi:hypothetical protein